MSYQNEYQSSIEDPEKFWGEKASLIDWFKAPQNILSTDEHGIQHWYADGELNTSHLALDYHVEHGRQSYLLLSYYFLQFKYFRRILYAQIQKSI